MNGAEVVYRASFPHRASDAFEVQTRARALDNNFFVIAPNVGTYYLTADDDTPIDTFGGHSMIVDYLGRVVGEHAYSSGSSWVAGTIDIHALRHFRANAKLGQLDEGPHDRAVPARSTSSPSTPRTSTPSGRPTSTTSTAARCSSRRCDCCRSAASTPRSTRPPTGPRRCPRRSRPRSTCRPTWSPNPPDSRLTARAGTVPA